MDSSTDILAGTVRAKRHAIDNDLELLRLRAERVQPREIAVRWGRRSFPIVVGAATLMLWRRRQPKVRSLDHLLVRTLSDLYAAERHQLSAIEWMGAAASNPDLAALLARHTGETRTHVDRLLRVLRAVGARPRRASARTMTAIEADARQGRNVRPDLRDAWLIATAQRAEHLEIAGYGTARSFAEALGHTYAARLLQQTLDEERAMDAQLSALAERFVNPQTIR
jgi:ferritin-like metal-binding protein YciE